MARSTKILNISLSPELYDKIERTAEEESRTKSDMIREAFRQYSSNKKWAQIREWGDATAVKMNIRDEQDIENILHNK